MKHGTLYAKKLKKAQSRIRGCGAQWTPHTTDPIEHLIVAVLSQETSVQRAEKAMRRLREDMVDYNELRVSSPAEVSASLQDHVPHPVQRAKALNNLLNAIFRSRYSVSLDGLSSRGVREIKSYLEGLDGITPYVTAYMLLWSLGGHAIPVNDPTLEMLRREELVDSNADVAEVQAFLERHISAADAQDFARDLAAFAGSGGRASASGESAVRRGKSTPPRTKNAATGRRTTGASAKVSATGRASGALTRKRTGTRRKK
jgi:endonuclease III